MITEAFVGTAKALAEACGMPGYPFAVIAHPIAADDDAALRAKAREAVRQCVDLLTSR